MAPQPEILGLYSVFAAGQRVVGSSPPVIVRSLGEAWGLLGLRRPVFTPVDLQAIRGAGAVLDYSVLARRLTTPRSHR